jgi:hypothetical protein
MAIGKATITQQATVVPTGTGSLYFVIEGTPRVGLQVAKPVGATTMEFLEFYYSNISRTEIPSVGGDEGMPVTSSAYPWVWAGPDTGVAASFTASAPASLLVSTTASHGRFLNVRWGSKTGGAFILSMHRKD